MIIKGNNHAPFKVNKGTKGYNVWVYKTSTNTNPDGVIRHHYKMLTTHGKYHSREDATAVAWHYIENHSYAHCAAWTYKLKYTNQNQLYLIMTTQRFTNLFEAVDFLTANFPLSRQQATHFVWDHSFTIGTDKGVWIDTRFVKVS